MAQEPDVFNKTMASLDENCVIIRMTNGEYVSRGKAKFLSGNIAKSLLAIGINLGDCVAITCANNRNRILAEMACIMAGFPFLSLKSQYLQLKHNQLGVNFKKNIIDHQRGHDAAYIIDQGGLDIKYNINDFTVNHYSRISPTNDITDFPTLDDPISINFTSGTTGQKKIMKRTRGKSFDKINRTINFTPGINQDISEAESDNILYIIGTPVLSFGNLTSAHLMLKNFTVILDNDHKKVNWKYIVNNIIDYGVTNLTIYSDILPTHPLYDEYVKENPFWASYSGKLDEMILEFSRVTTNISIRLITPNKNSLYAYEIIANAQKNITINNIYGASDSSVSWHIPQDSSIHDKIHIAGFHIDTLKNGAGKLISIAGKNTYELAVNKEYRFDYAQDIYNVQYVDDIYIRTGDEFILNDNGIVQYIGRV
jgi:acyl-coenzyme A synthetase/AMP-(fatty) acid ligase